MVETGVSTIVLSSLKAFVLWVVTSVEGALHLLVIYFISYSCIGRSPLVWKWGSSSRQVAPSSILERQRGGGLLIYPGSGVKRESVCLCVCVTESTKFFPSSPTMRMDAPIMGGFNPWLWDWTIMVWNRLRDMRTYLSLVQRLHGGKLGKYI